MVPKKDSKPFLVKFPIGASKTTKVDMEYEEDWNLVYGLISDPSGAIRNYVYGSDLGTFDKVIIANAGSITRLINYDTIVLVDNMPTDTYSGGDYSIKRIFPEHNGEIVIGLTAKEAVNIPKLYYERNGKVLYYQLNYDKNKHVAYANKNQIIPFARNSFVWTREPADTSSTKNRLKVVSLDSKVGFDERYVPFTEIKFEVDNG